MGNAARRRQLLGDEAYYAGNPLWACRKKLGVNALDETRTRMIQLLTTPAEISPDECEELALFVPLEVVEGLAQFIDSDPELPPKAETGIPNSWPETMRAAAYYGPSRQWAFNEARNIAATVGLHLQSRIQKRWIAVATIAAVSLNANQVELKL
jgi:hypothetical protein